MANLMIIVSASIVGRMTPTGAVSYLREHRSGAFLMVILATMLTAILMENWILFGCLAGGGTYLELVHIRHLLQKHQASVTDPV